MHVHSKHCGCSFHVHRTLADGLRSNVSLRRDPTRTTTIRQRYEKDLVRRFKVLRKAIKDLVGKEDAFGLRTNIRTNAKFDFARSSDKVSAFMDWLETMERQGILEVSRGTRLASAAQGAWQNVYILSAYQKGLAQAAGLMRNAGADIEQRWIDAAFLRPIHADRVGLIYTRVYRDLEGITDAMDQQMSRVLAQGLSEGRGPNDIANDLADRVDKIGITRARALARTETISAHAEATLNTYEEAGLEGVEVLSEFTVTDDNVLCPICEDLAGTEYTIEEARGVIPVHPNCRCAWLPVVQDARGVVLR